VKAFLIITIRLDNYYEEQPPHLTQQGEKNEESIIWCHSFNIIKPAIKYTTHIGIGIHRYTVHRRFREVQTI
jgi:hypothetical protein